MHAVPDFFEDARFGAIPWLPDFSFQAGPKVYGIDVFRGDPPTLTMSHMQAAMAAVSAVQAAFFVPTEENWEHIKEQCFQSGIALIVNNSDVYEVLLPGTSPSPQVAGFQRIPAWVVERLLALSKLEPSFCKALVSFAKRYSKLVNEGGLNDDRQQALLLQAFRSILNSDIRFSAFLQPLATLRFFEQARGGSGKDHFFHTFNNFLLGCIVIDASYDEFAQSCGSCFPGPALSVEFIWFLTVFFHDVGYPIQKMGDSNELLYGINVESKEQTNAHRKQLWDSPPFQVCRSQLVSIYSHLTQPSISSAWTPDPFPLSPHALDVAFQTSFVEHGHGVASALRMLVDFVKRAPTSPEERRFLARHIFLGALSIPFHDWPVRKYLREQNIAKLRTSRLPFATLLMFIDSIQEDRRGQTQVPDILISIEIVDKVVTAQIDSSKLSEEGVREKKREFADVKSFLQEDGLQFAYPEEFVDHNVS